MEDRESGSLSDKPALDLLVELHRGSVTGSLKLERAPLQKAVYFRDGQILFAASNDPKDQLASILVEEGKLGPDQMQVAQARVSPGNPLAKVLTELGYISQRELADAARIKVEKILTDLYGWNEGTYQFLTKSLPKGAIDLELSTARLLFASIRRVQDRDWVLAQLGSLEAVLTPTAELERFVEETHADPLSAEVLRLVDGVKTVKQIGAVSSLGEFEVCKVLAAAIVGGALSGGAGGGRPTFASDEAFAFPSSEPGFPPPPSFGAETVGVPVTSPVEQEPISYDTIFQAAARPSHQKEEVEKTVFEPPPPPSRPMGTPLGHEPRRGPAASELLIDEPEPETSDDPHARRAPRPKKMKGGGASRGGGGMIKWLGAAVLAGAAGFSVYYFVFPLVFPKGKGGPPPSSSRTAVPPPPVNAGTNPSTTPTPDGGSATTDPRATGTGTSPAPSPSPSTVPAAATSTVPPSSASGTPSPRPAQPTPTSTSTPTQTARATTSAPTRQPTPAPAPPSGAPRPPATTSSPPVSAGAGGGGRALLQSGRLDDAARAFQREILSTGARKFTIAIGLYCNEENAGRIVGNARGSNDIYVLPASIQGKSCYRIVWGLFDSADEAQRGMGSVPSAVRGGDAAVVAVSKFLQ